MENISRTLQDQKKKIILKMKNKMSKQTTVDEGIKSAP